MSITAAKTLIRTLAEKRRAPQGLTSREMRLFEQAVQTVREHEGR